MRSRTPLAAALAIAALGGAAAPAAASAATVRVGHTSAGAILTTGSGFTLYMFTADGRNRNHCIKVSGCSAVWPALTVSGHPTAGRGVHASLLGTITLPGGRHQVTYAGHPLYRYTGDSGAGDTSYLGFSSFGGRWDGLTASGGPVK